MEEVLKQIAPQSPWLALVGAFLLWVMKAVVIPLKDRHMAFVDTLEKRDFEKQQLLNELGNDVAEIRRTQLDHIEICRHGPGSPVPPRPVKPQPKPA